MSAQVQKLKDEGNSLYLSKEYQLAIVKYTEAIELDDSNALLYANRAACWLALKHYLDALADAKKATELDPNYSKAWARCAAASDALGKYNSSRKMWQKALDALPTEEKLSEMEKHLKQQYESGLKASNVAAGRRENKLPENFQVRNDTCNFPWEVASRMLDGLKQTNNFNSIAWTIYAANKEFTEAMEFINSLQIEVQGEDEARATGRSDAITLLTNAILRDSRVFRIERGDILIDLANQVTLERFHTNSWHGDAYGPEFVKKEAVERLHTQSRDEVRKALTLTVRNWILNGFLYTKVSPRYTLAIEYLRCALDIINWGREEWKNVPEKDRGVIFSLTFRRGVWNMLMDVTMEAYNHCNSPDQKVNYLEDIKANAEGLIRDIEENPPNIEELREKVDTGFMWSFYDNIRGNAFACIGFYYIQLSDMTNPNADRRHVYKHLLAASQCYQKAAFGYPVDDYNHPWYLNCAFQCLGPIGTPTKLIMEILERIKTSLPKVNDLWFRRPDSVPPERAQAYEKLAKIEEKAKRLLDERKMCLNGLFDWNAVQRGLA